MLREGIDATGALASITLAADGRRAAATEKRSELESAADASEAPAAEAAKVPAGEAAAASSSISVAGHRLGSNSTMQLNPCAASSASGSGAGRGASGSASAIASRFRYALLRVGNMMEVACGWDVGGCESLAPALRTLGRRDREQQRTASARAATAAAAAQAHTHEHDHSATRTHHTQESAELARTRMHTTIDHRGGEEKRFEHGSALVWRHENSNERTPDKHGQGRDGYKKKRRRAAAVTKERSADREKGREEGRERGVDTREEEGGEASGVSGSFVSLRSLEGDSSCSEREEEREIEFTAQRPSAAEAPAASRV